MVIKAATRIWEKKFQESIHTSMRQNFADNQTCWAIILVNIDSLVASSENDPLKLVKAFV